MAIEGVYELDRLRGCHGEYGFCHSCTKAGYATSSQSRSSDISIVHEHIERVHHRNGKNERW